MAKSKKRNRKQPRLNPDQIVEMRRLKAEGLSARKIAETMGLSYSSTHRYTTPKYVPSEEVRALEKGPTKIVVRRMKATTPTPTSTPQVQGVGDVLDVNSIVRAALEAGTQVIILGSTR